MAVVDIELFGSPPRHRWPVGLDGVYRMSKGPYDAPQGIRGFWADSQTFVFEYEGITSNDHKMLSMRFERDRVAVEVREIAHELGARFEGRLRQPGKGLKSALHLIGDRVISRFAGPTRLP
jgi:hypothetical protein